MRRIRPPLWITLPAVLSLAAAAAVALQVGEPAPAFEAASTHGRIRLADYQGKKRVLLAFYLKDFTSG